MWLSYGSDVGLGSVGFVAAGRVFEARGSARDMQNEWARQHLAGRTVVGGVHVVQQCCIAVQHVHDA